MSYLSQDHLFQFLARGKFVEQWKGPLSIGDRTFLRRFGLGKSKNGGYLVILSDVFPDKEIGIFARLIPFDYDEPEGHFAYFETHQAALNYLVGELGASPDSFIPLGEIQQEYEKFLGSQAFENAGNSDKSVGNVPFN